MNKGIIIEKHINFSIVLTSDGSFEKAVILEPQADVGEEVLYEPYERVAENKKAQRSKHHRSLRFGIITAVLLPLFLFSSFQFIESNKTYAYITIDINPSLDIRVDKFMKIQHITPKNEDAELLLSSFPEDKKTDLYTMIDEIMDSYEKYGFTKGKGNMLVGISYADEKHQEIESTLRKRDTNWNIISFDIPSEIRQRAQKNNTSMNKEFALLIRDRNNLADIKMNKLKVERIHSFYDELDVQ